MQTTKWAKVVPKATMMKNQGGWGVKWGEDAYSLDLRQGQERASPNEGPVTGNSRASGVTMWQTAEAR